MVPSVAGASGTASRAPRVAGSRAGVRSTRPLGNPRLPNSPTMSGLGGGTGEQFVRWVHVSLVLAIVLGSNLSGVNFSPGHLPSSHVTPTSTETMAPSSSTSLPSGWSFANRTINWTNYTLPYFPGTRYFNGPSNIFDSPVIAANPSGTLTAYYVNASSQLVAYSLGTGRVVTIGTWPTNLSDYDSPSIVQGIQNAGGNVSALFEMGAVSSGYVWVAWYSLLNGSYLLANTTIFEGTEPIDIGLGAAGADGWVYWTDAQMIRIDFFNIYSGQLVTSTWSPLTAWNSPVFVPTADQIVEDANVAPNNTIEIRVANLTFPGGDATVDARTIWGGPYAFITGADVDNMPYFFNATRLGTILWGLGANAAVPGATFHAVEMSLNQNLSRDSILDVADTGLVGTTDTGAFALWDASGYSLNGYDGYVNGSDPGADQAPFLNPLTKTVIYANNSDWFNNFLTGRNFAFGVGPWINTWEFIGPTAAWENAVLYGSTSNRSCGSTCTILLYWIPNPTVVVASGTPSSPFDLTTTSTTTTISWTWSQSSENSLTNDTIYLFNGLNCSASSILRSSSTNGPADTFTESGLSDGGAPYSASVTSWIGPNASAPSSCVGTTTFQSPTAPSALTTQATTSDSVTLSWTNPSVGPLDNLTVYYGTNLDCEGTLYAVSAGITSTYTIRHLSPAATYSFEVGAWTEGVRSSLSSCLVATTLPNPPGSLSIASVGPFEDGQAPISLEWTNPPGELLQNSVYEGASCTEASPIMEFSTPSPVTSLTVGLFLNGTPTYFLVTAWSAGGQSLASRCVSDVATAPVNLTVNPTSPTSVRLTWSDATSPFEVFNTSVEFGSSCSELNSSIQTRSGAVEANITTLVSGRSYCFAVKDWTFGGYSPWSNTAVGGGFGPAAPGDLRITRTTPTAIRLAWNPPLSTVTGFELEWADSNESGRHAILVGASVVSLTIPGLHPSTTYLFSIQSWNGTLVSEPSMTVIGTTTSLTVPGVRPPDEHGKGPGASQFPIGTPPAPPLGLGFTTIVVGPATLAGIAVVTLSLVHWSARKRLGKSR
jgi:hypothetical protein